MLNLLQTYRSKAQRRAKLSRRFTAVHDLNLWGDTESRSGGGSARNSPSVAVAAQALKKAVAENAVRTLSDIPCGDFNWMPDVLKSLPDLEYIGFDIVFSALASNKARFPDLEFRQLDIVTAVPPPADLIFCKDLFNHLDDADVGLAIENMKKSRSKFLLASNNPGYVNTPLPKDRGASRHLDITAPPFGFRAPLWTMEGYMSLWRLQDIGVAKPPL